VVLHVAGVADKAWRDKFKVSVGWVWWVIVNRAAAQMENSPTIMHI